MTAIRTYEVLCTWIESSKTLDHIMCINSYIDNIFRSKFTKETNPLHQELIDSLRRKVELKEVELGVNEYIRLFCRKNYLEFIEWVDTENPTASFHNGDEQVNYELNYIIESLKQEECY